MAQLFTKMKLSASTDGRMIKVVPIVTAGTLIHTAHATSLDEIWLYAVNSSAVNVKITTEYGGVASPDDLIEITVPAESGLVCIVPGLLLSNSLLVRVFAATANVVMVGGFVNRIT